MKTSELLIMCSGADNNVLQHCSMKERTKYIGIGSTLVLTSILAALSGGYAIFSTFQSLPIAIVIGAFWGIVIFSLDRYIITSIDKRAGLWTQFFNALPRILMAIVLALTISKPIELRLFQSAINKAMSEIAGTSITACEDDWNRKRDDLANSKSKLEGDRKIRSEEIYNKDGIYSQLAVDQTGLVSSNRTSSRDIIQNNAKINRGTSYKTISFKEDGSPVKIIKRSAAAVKALKENTALNKLISKNVFEIGEIEKQKDERKIVLKEQVATTEDQYTKQIAGVQQQIDDHNNSRSRKIVECTDLANDAKDIPSQLKALSKLTNENSSVANASILITILFVLLETAPVVVKLLSSTGVYDELVEALDYEKSMEAKIKISNLNDEINTHLRISIDKNKNKLDAELKANAELLNSIALAQAEIAKIAVERWKEDEIAKLKVSNTDYVNQ